MFLPLLGAVAIAPIPRGKERLIKQIAMADLLLFAAPLDSLFVTIHPSL